MAIRKKAAKKKAAKKAEEKVKEAVDYPSPDSTVEILPDRDTARRDEFADGYRQALIEVRDKLAPHTHPAVLSRIGGVLQWLESKLGPDASDDNALKEGDDA